jgi:hypothetical protein
MCGALQHLGINKHLWGRRLRREQQELALACVYQRQAWQYLTEALEIARESDWRVSIADGLNRLGKVYREIHRLEHLPAELMDQPDTKVVLQELRERAVAYTLPFELEYEHELLMPGRFDDLSWLGKAARLFDVSALMADEVNSYHRSLESLTEAARVLEELNLNEKVPVVLRRIERIKGYDYQEALFAAMGEIIKGDLDYKHGRLDVAFETYQQVYIRIAQLPGYAKYLLDDRLRDLEWRLKALPRQTALDRCDALEGAWMEPAILVGHPEMLDMLERVRSEVYARQE